MGEDNSVLVYWLWKDFNIFVLFLPARTPEWNPIKMLWNCLEERLKHFDWIKVRGNHRVVKATRKVLDGITHEEVKSFYRACI